MTTSYSNHPDPHLVASAEEVDPLEAIARRAAQQMIQAALEREVEEYLGRHRYEHTAAEAEFRGYRNGMGRERSITGGFGTVTVAVPRVCDTPPEQEPFTSQIIRPYQKRSRTVAELFPKLFVEGLATRDFEPALRELMGAQAALSPSTISRLNQKFKAEYEAWRHSSLSEHTFVYIWADGIHLKAGISTENAAILVVIGVDAAGTKHFLAIEEGYRESKESWLEVLRGLHARGMNQPALAVADGALGFWAALPQVWSQTKAQRCWFHKAANILDKLPQRERAEAAKRIRAIYLAPSRAEAERLARLLIGEWRAVHYQRAADCLSVDLVACLQFFDYPQEHWRHLRTTNPIESVFASIRLRTDAAKRLRTARSGVHLIFQLLQRYEKSWLRLSAPERLREVALPGALQAAAQKLGAAA
ncbi:MAG: IS256 family transposase [Pyrinomonadaceae bacterium]|nr:IS256 family transposase [Pyrinomonadaceae bacterium]